MVWFVYREEYYLASSEPEHPVPGEPTEKFDKYNKWEEKIAPARNMAELIIAKQRHGATGKVRLKFEAKITRFSDHIEADHLPEMRG